MTLYSQSKTHWLSSSSRGETTSRQSGSCTTTLSLSLFLESIRRCDIDIQKFFFSNLLVHGDKTFLFLGKMGSHPGSSHISFFFYSPAVERHFYFSKVCSPEFNSRNTPTAMISIHYLELKGSSLSKDRTKYHCCSWLSIMPFDIEPEQRRCSARRETFEK